MGLPIDEPNEEERLEQLPEDYATPFSLPDDSDVTIADTAEATRSRPVLDDTHPSTDSNFEISEAYHSGRASTAGAEEPNAGDEVIGYRVQATKHGAVKRRRA